MASISQWKDSQVDGKSDKFKRRAAMKFYVTVLSQLLTVSEQNNCFLSGMLSSSIKLHSKHYSSSILL